MSQALYRRYRPETFAEVIGQEHVTEPLAQALRADRVTHAYLFSGPRGCGKTTSARILARCLNCAQGPTPEPCGTCDSCVELGRGGSGSLDVVEIDAASHNGVDDARDLRERAAFAPARDRYKVFILDEAHMVTPQGFNALLKIVEEPPPHVKFIFATTEPDKVIGTIRSRTHHYPFRLVAPDTLLPYLEQLCREEGVAVGAGVLPLVVRAGGGSVRDSLSVLDQLIAGADEGGLDYERSVALLGYTHAALLDDVVGAISTRDGASAFRVVDRVISSGHEPRRFIEDLLERLRDLIVIAASGESARAALRDLPSDQLERMRAQAAALGPAELSRSADLVNTALTEMTGATSPRLHLELLVARLLLPAMDDGGVVARLERVERAVDGAPRVAPAPEAAPVPGRRPPRRSGSGRPSRQRPARAPEHRRCARRSPRHAPRRRPSRRHPCAARRRPVPAEPPRRPQPECPRRTPRAARARGAHARAAGPGAHRGAGRRGGDGPPPLARGAPDPARPADGLVGARQPERPGGLGRGRRGPAGVHHPPARPDVPHRAARRARPPRPARDAGPGRPGRASARAERRRTHPSRGGRVGNADARAGRGVLGRAGAPGTGRSVRPAPEAGSGARAGRRVEPDRGVGRSGRLRRGVRPRPGPPDRPSPPTACRTRRSPTRSPNHPGPGRHPRRTTAATPAPTTPSSWGLAWSAPR